MSFPIDRIRNGTPGCHDKLFFNTAGSSLVSQEVLDIGIEYQKREADIGGYDLMMESESKTAAFYKESSELIHAHPRNMAYCTSATDAYSKVLYAFDWSSKDTILTTKDDYVSNILSFLNIKKRFGTKIVFTDILASGDLDLDDLRQKLGEFQPRLFALTHMPTSSGVIYDAMKAGELCQEYETPFLLDACQTIGQIDVNVLKIQCDFLSVTGRKFLRGPRGTGFLFVSDRILEGGMVPLSLDLAGNEWTAEMDFSLGSEAKRFEFWERNYSNLLGLTQSIREINEIGISNIESYSRDLGNYMRIKMSAIPNLQLFDKGSNLGNIITWKRTTKNLGEHQELLAKNRIFYSIASTRNALIDLNRKEQEWLIRFSPHFFNTIDEIDQTYKILESWS